MAIWRGIKGGGGGVLQPSLPPHLHQNCRNTALQSLMAPGPRPSVLANGTHTQRQLCWHVHLFIFGYLLLSLGYPRVDATPESAGRCVDLFWEAGYQCLSAGRIQEAFHVRPP